MIILVGRTFFDIDKDVILVCSRSAKMAGACRTWIKVFLFIDFDRFGSALKQTASLREVCAWSDDATS